MAHSTSVAAAIELSVIVVSYNTRELTVACLDSLEREMSALSCAIEVLVVDNASSDGSAAAIRAHRLAPRLLAFSQNIGFAAANNRAASEARGRYLLLLNPDTVVRQGALAHLLAIAADRPAAGIWGGRTFFADGRLNPSSCWGRMTAWSLFCRASGLAALFPNRELFNPEGYGGWRRDSVREVDIVSGCFLLIARELWSTLGGFDPTFFMYGEDADLCLRARRLAARPAITPEAIIIHVGGASEPAQAGKMQKLLTAKATLIRRHWAARSVPLGIFLLQGWPWSRRIAFHVCAWLTGSTGARATAAMWDEVWSTRRVWSRGYPPAARCPSIPVCEWKMQPQAAATSTDRA